MAIDCVSWRTATACPGAHLLLRSAHMQEPAPLPEAVVLPDELSDEGLDEASSGPRLASHETSKLLLIHTDSY